MSEAKVTDFSLNGSANVFFRISRNQEVKTVQIE